MTREDQILSEAKKHYYDSINCHNAFLHGVEWADEHPANVWHDASEEPIEYPILCKDELSNIWTELSLTNYVEGWAVYVEFNDMSQWAYINDLLPKGGEK